MEASSASDSFRVSCFRITARRNTTATSPRGQTGEDITGRCVSGNKVSNFILVCRPNINNELNSEHLSYIIDIANAFNKNTPIKFILLYSGKIDSVKKEKLKDIIKTYNIVISEVSDDYIKKYYKISEKANGIIILIDKQNKVRFANKMFNLEEIINIIKSELFRG